MDVAMRSKILNLLDRHRIMTLATVRPDGWPQATTVGFVHDGLALYFLCGPHSQKAANLARNPRVSLTIDHDSDDLLAIMGLSMAAHAQRVTDPEEGEWAMAGLVARYAKSSLAGPLPEARTLCIVRLEPVIISLIDYHLGFGHTDLVACMPADLAATATRRPVPVMANLAGRRA